MKCSLCNVEVKETAKAVGLNIATNHQEEYNPSDPLIVILGFWNTKQNKTIEICTSCIGEKLISCSNIQK